MEALSATGFEEFLKIQLNSIQEKLLAEYARLHGRGANHVRVEGDTTSKTRVNSTNSFSANLAASLAEAASKSSINQAWEELNEEPSESLGDVSATTSKDRPKSSSSFPHVPEPKRSTSETRITALKTARGSPPGCVEPPGEELTALRVDSDDDADSHKDPQKSLSASRLRKQDTAKSVAYSSDCKEEFDDHHPRSSASMRDAEEQPHYNHARATFGLGGFKRSGSAKSLMQERARQNRRDSAFERFAVLDAKAQERQANARLVQMRRSLPTLSNPSINPGDAILTNVHLARNLQTAAVRRASLNMRESRTARSEAGSDTEMPPAKPSTPRVRISQLESGTEIGDPHLADVFASELGAAGLSGVFVPTTTDMTDRDDQAFEVADTWAAMPLTMASISQGLKRTSTKATSNQLDEATKTAQAEEDEMVKRVIKTVKPGSGINIMWDSIGLLLIAWDCFFVPLAFFEANEDDFTLATVMAWIGRIFWTLNIGMSCLTGYINKQGAMISDSWKIAKHYAVTWFPLDLFIVGSDWLELLLDDASNSTQYTRIGVTLRTLRMVRTVRLLRLARAPAIATHVAEQVRSEELLLVAHMCKIMAGMLLAAHFIACMWYGVGVVDMERGWVRTGELHDERLARKYIWSLHWSIATFMGETISMTDTLGERAFTVAVLFFGFMFSSALVGSLTTAMTKLQIISSKQSAEMSQLKRYLLNKGISRPLAVRVQRNAQHVLWEQKQNMPEDAVALLKLISMPLLIEIHFEVWFETLRDHPLFDCLRETNPAGIRKVCHTCVIPQSLSKGDILFTELEVPTQPRMFFVLKGEVRYSQADRQVIEEVRRPQWLCEPVLWTTWRHAGTLKAASEARLLALDALRFRHLWQGTMEVSMARYARFYCEVLNEIKKHELTDIGCLNEDVEDMICYAFPDLEQANPVARDEEGGLFGLRRQESLHGLGMLMKSSDRSNNSAGKRRRRPLAALGKVLQSLPGINRESVRNAAKSTQDRVHGVIPSPRRRGS